MWARHIMRDFENADNKVNLNPAMVWALENAPEVNDMQLF
jgi:hypothetical protein